MGHDEGDLDAVAHGHLQSEGFTPRLVECRARTLQRVLRAGDVLDLGCADGLLTAHLAVRHARVIAVDASAVRVERARAATAHLRNVDVQQARFEDWAPPPGRIFDGIVLSCVLEHVPDAPGLLRSAARWLAPEGRIVAIVPHGASLHRRAGVIMGLLRSVTDAGESDHALHHERVYTRESLRSEVEHADLRVVAEGGHLLKPLPNDRMALLTPDLVDAYEELGRELPDIAAEIWIAADRG